ncbi:MAG: response regulator transcription factor [Polyangiales bacterium]
MVPSPPPTRASRILVVDDEADQRDVLELLLRREGYEVDSAGDAGAALTFVGQRLPDAILLDLHMPGLDGFQLLDRLKSDARTAPVAIIVVSGSSLDSDVVRALERGATDYVTKPYAIEILLARVRAVLRSVREKEAIWSLQAELARTRKHAAIGAIAAGLAHEINNPAAFVVTDLHEVKELALDLGDAGDEERADALTALAEEALAGMHRIRDVVKDLSVFASLVDRRSTPSPQAIDVAAIVRGRVERFAGETKFSIADGAEAWVASGLAGEDELDALIGLLLRHAGTGRHVLPIAIERGDSVVVRIASAPVTEDEPAHDVTWGITIARELAERFGGQVAHTGEGWSLTLPKAAS